MPQKAKSPSKRKRTRTRSKSGSKPQAGTGKGGGSSASKGKSRSRRRQRPATPQGGRQGGPGRGGNRGRGAPRAAGNPHNSAQSQPLALESKHKWEDLLEEQSAKVRGIATRLREIIYDVMPNAAEQVYGHGFKIAQYSDPTPVCGIQPVGERCHFYLTHGARIEDPDGLLEGSGQGARHVKVRSVDDIPEDGIRRFILASREIARKK